MFFSTFFTSSYILVGQKLKKCLHQVATSSGVMFVEEPDFEHHTRPHIIASYPYGSLRYIIRGIPSIIFTLPNRFKHYGFTFCTLYKGVGSQLCLMSFDKSANSTPHEEDLEIFVCHQSVSREVFFTYFHYAFIVL